jgi:hypothetical protein
MAMLLPGSQSIAYNAGSVLGEATRYHGARQSQGVSVETQQGDSYLREQALRAATEQPPREAALALAELVNRAAVELHKLARAQAQATRGEPAWGDWAKLANAARTAVLQAASCRDAARGLGRGD